MQRQISSLLTSRLKAGPVFNCYSTKASQVEGKPLDWKKNVVVVPIATGPEDLKRRKQLKDGGFYINHRIYIKDVPEKYTVEPIKTYKTGGYDIDTRVRLFRRVGGGFPIHWHFIDFKRVGPKSGPPLVEKVIDIIKSRDRTAFIALVAHGDSKRYILATENMKIGDLIKTSQEIPRVPVKANEGDAHPCGALPIGTIVHNVEVVPGEGGVFCHAAGSSAVITSQIEDRVIIRLPSDQELSINKNCMVTVGQVSHATHKDEKLTHPVDMRDLGYRPGSGLWHRKDGYCGRKIHPPKPLKVIDERKTKSTGTKLYWTYKNWSIDE